MNTRGERELDGSVAQPWSQDFVLGLPDVLDGVIADLKVIVMITMSFDLKEDKY